MSSLANSCAVRRSAMMRPREYLTMAQRELRRVRGCQRAETKRVIMTAKSNRRSLVGICATSTPGDNASVVTAYPIPTAAKSDRHVRCRCTWARKDGFTAEAPLCAPRTSRRLLLYSCSRDRAGIASARCPDNRDLSTSAADSTALPELASEDNARVSSEDAMNPDVVFETGKVGASFKLLAMFCPI